MAAKHTLSTEPLSQFVAWWIDTASDDATGCAAKASEYGSEDLYQVGRMVAHLTGREVTGDAQAFELGCLFYTYGKIARLVSAYQRGATPSDDTWHDLGIYAKMVLAHRADVWGEF